MSITIEESRLVDSAAQYEHSRRTGYDYGKRIQLEIQALVESEITIREMFRAKAKATLLPKPGVYNSTIIVKSEDVLAYSASHPQISCKDSERKRIIEMLKSGASAQSLPKTKEDERVEISGPELSFTGEEIHIKVIDSSTREHITSHLFSSLKEYTSWVNRSDLLSINLCADEAYDYEVVQSPSEGPKEDFVNSKVFKDAELLICQNATYYPPISQSNTHITSKTTFAKSSLGKTDDSIIGEVSKDTEIKVIDNHLGDKAKWAIAESDSLPSYGRFYISLKDISILSGVKEFPKNLNDTRSKPDNSAVSIDWTTQPLDTPYYDAKTAKHRVVVSTGYKKLDSESSYAQILAESFKKGAFMILGNYGKDRSDEKINQYEENDYYDNAIRAVDLFVSDRQGSEIVALVECPHRNLIRAEEAEREELLHYFVEDYDVSLFKDYISQLTRKIDSLSELLEKFPGKIVSFTPEKESEYLSLVPNTIDEVFKQNGIDAKGIFTKKGLLTIGWDLDFKIVSMKFEEQNGKTFRAHKGLTSAKRRDHMDARRTQNLVFMLNNILASGLEDSWTDFLTNYISYDEVKIIPLSVPEMVTELGEKEGPPIKTLKELQKEESFFSKTKRKNLVAKKRSTETDFVGASVLDPRKLKNIKSKISGTTGDAYKLFLNSVDFRKVVFKTVKGLIPQSATPHLDFIKRQVDSIESDVKNYGEKRIKLGLKKVEGRASREIAKLQETQEDLSKGLEKYHKYKRQYENFETTLQELSDRQYSFSAEDIYNSDIAQELQQEAAEVADQLSEDAEQALVRQISETTGLEPETVIGIKDKIPDLLGKKISFEDVKHFPEITFKDNIATDDISEAFVEGLKNAASAMVNEMIKSLVKNTLDALEKVLNNQDRNNRIPESDINLPGVSVEPESRDAAEDVLGAPIAKIENILDDTTNLLSPEELCALFDGQPNGVTVDLMRTVMRTTYPELEILSASQISDFFNSLAVYTNFNSCRDLIEAEVPDIFMDDFACPPNNSLREGILRDKGLDDDQLRKQIENERQRSRNLAEDLLDQLKNGMLSENFEAPSDFCSNSSSGSTPGQNSFMDDNFKYSLRSTLNKTFETVYTSFKAEGKEYSKSLFQEIRSKRTIRVPSFTDPTELVEKEIDILEKKPLAKFERFIKKPDITFPQNFRSTRLISEEENIDLGAGDIPETLRNLESSSEGATTTLLELPTPSGQIRYALQVPGSTYAQSTPVISSTSYEFSSKGFLEEMLIGAYEERTNITEQQKNNLNDNMINLHNEVKEKIFRSIFRMMEDSPYFKDLSQTESTEFLLDYVNLGPELRPECDPHLLKVSDEVNEIFNKFKEDMCADNVQTPSGVKPSKNALESSMMAACVRLTLRHYLIETLVKGLVSLSTITGSGKISDLILDYVSTKLQKSLDKYGREYKEDFLKEVEEMYTGQPLTIDGKLKSLIKEEFDNVSGFLYESLLLGGKTISFKNNLFNRTRIIEFEVKIDGTTSTVEVDPDDSPFVIVMEEDSSSLCVIVNSTVPKPSEVNGHYYKRVKLSGDKRAILMPVVKLEDPTRNYNTIKRELYRNAKTQRLLDVCFPLDIYASAVHVHEMEMTSKIQPVVSAFGDTRDSLYSIFYTILPQADDWKKENKALASIAGSTGMSGGAALTALWDFNFGVFDTPAGPNSFNYGLPLGWGQSFTGLFFSFAAKAVKDAALKIYKESVEKSDLNISFAKTISKRMKLVGVNVSTTEVSIILAALPIAPFNPYLPTPSTIIYNALGLGTYLKSNILAEDSEEARRAKEKIEAANLKPPKYCEDMLLD